MASASRAAVVFHSCVEGAGQFTKRLTGSIVPAAMPSTKTHGSAAENLLRHGDDEWMWDDRAIYRVSLEVQSELRR